MGSQVSRLLGYNDQQQPQHQRRPTPAEYKCVMPDVDAYALEWYSAEMVRERHGLHWKTPIEELKEKNLGVYLNRFPHEFSPNSFIPVEGMIAPFEPQNFRMIVDLACKAATGPAVQVFFVIDTTSPYTFLSFEAAEALQLLPAKERAGRTMNTLDDASSEANQSSSLSFPVQIHTSKFNGCYLSGPGFPEVNILGVDFFTLNNLKLSCDYDHLVVRIIESSQETDAGAQDEI